jgi:hypothetical protein
MGGRNFVLGGALICGLAAGSAALADDFFPSVAQQTPDYSFSFIQEARFGVYAHNVIHNEDAPVDLSFETLSSQLGPSPFANPYISWFFTPRINFGGMINTGGKTSYGFTGFTWRIPIYGPVFFEGEFGGAANNAVRQPTPNRIDMGCVLTFRESGGFGIQLSKNFDFIVNVEHVSHATFCSKINPGITNFGFRVGYKF